VVSATDPCGRYFGFLDRLMYILRYTIREDSFLSAVTCAVAFLHTYTTNREVHSMTNVVKLYLWGAECHFATQTTTELSA
jgi:hypothetical protein